VQTVPVIISADSVVKSFAAHSRTHAALEKIAGPERPRKLYRPEMVWKANFADGRDLRAIAAERLGNKAPEFVTACLQRDKNGTPKNKITVAWERAADNATGGEAA
jgi:hypothetical protein